MIVSFSKSILIRYRLRFASLFQLSLSETTPHSQFLHVQSGFPLRKKKTLPISKILVVSLLHFYTPAPPPHGFYHSIWSPIAITSLKMQRANLKGTWMLQFSRRQLWKSGKKPQTFQALHRYITVYCYILALLTYTHSYSRVLQPLLRDLAWWITTIQRCFILFRSFFPTKRFLIKAKSPPAAGSQFIHHPTFSNQNEHT